MTAAIEIQSLRFRWPAAQQHTLAIDDWSVPAGRRLFLYGPSGSGKSTLLNLLAGILLPVEGHCKILGTDLATLRGWSRDRFRARHIGYIFQQFNLLPYLSVEDNILLAGHFGGSVTGPEAIDAALDRLALPRDLRRQRADALSVGQQQRVAVVRALVNNPQLILADEPTSALDSDARDRFIELLLQSAADSNATVLFVSHDRSLAAHFDAHIDLRDLNRTAEKVEC